MIEFILKFDVKPEKQAEVFKGRISHFIQFKAMATDTLLSDKLHLDVLEREIYSANQILILLDIGGSILYRHPDDEPIDVSRKPDFKLRRHLHFFRPFYEDFIAALLQHPRVKLAFYTSITHKNALPLLFQLFESAHLKVFKSDLFALFD